MNEELEEAINRLENEYIGETITYLIEINDEYYNQVAQFGNFVTPQQALSWLQQNYIFINLDNYCLDLFYEVKDIDIDKFANIKIKNGKLVLENYCV